MNSIGHRIKTIREYRRYSQEFMAEELRINQSSYSRIESGVIRIDLDKLKSISSILGIQLLYFILEADVRDYNRYID